MSKAIEDILQDINDLVTELNDTWQPETVLNSEDLHKMTLGLEDVLTDLANATTNEAEDTVSSTGWNGIYMNRRKAGGTYSYWIGGTATATKNIPANTKEYLATVTDFPELADYQGASIPVVVCVFDPTLTSVFSAELVGIVDATGFYINQGSTAQQIGAGNTLGWNTVLTLGEVVE